MAIIVQKYGGSSVADAEKIKNVARRLMRAQEQGNQVVAVVSAMGKTTDNLISLANEVSTRPNRREMDSLLSTGEIVTATLLTMALRSAKHRAISLTGAQAGITTDASHSKAKITGINPERIIEELNRDRIVIVAGFQGITEGMDVTTLGRGGSDTTAVALAIGLNADKCEIYTDVEGVHTADPRMVPVARKIDEIGYEDMLELGSVGAKVMHSRAVELGWVYNMPILVASSFNDNPGTLIHGGVPMEIRNKVSGIAHDLNIAKITVVGVPDKPGIASTIFEELADKGVSVDSIVQNASVNRITDLTFTLARGDLQNAMKTLEPVVKSIGARECVSDATLGKVSIIGAGMQSGPGYASRMFKALSDKGINIELISTSEIRITCIIDGDKVPEAVQALHDVFELEA